MTKVFIGGSSRVSRLDEKIKSRLDEIIRKQLPVVIGDANGADKAVQDYFHQRAYEQVEVFCMEGHCRNNAGNWRIRSVPPPYGRKHDFEYYAAKDRLMAEEGSFGFMLWDGKSRETFENILRLAEEGKEVIVYLASTKEFRTVGK
ncbi:MAG TPA: hypothetical protein VMO17_14710 [Terriglobia bacterium]|nr:hypothetical protein [Terriglobia bacterium]